MLTYLTPNTTIEIICFLVAVICLTTESNFVWRIMVLYLLITCIVEFSGVYFAIKMHNNNWVYNIFLLCETGFTNLMFFHLFNKYIKSKPLIIAGLALFTVLYILGLHDHGFFIYNNITYTAMSIVYVLYSLYYYYLLIKDEYYIKIKHSAEFWWVAGTLFFYFANTTCNFYEKKFEYIMITSKENLNYFIFAGLNIILYSLWSYSFICKKWATKKSKN